MAGMNLRVVPLSAVLLGHDSEIGQRLSQVMAGLGPAIHDDSLQVRPHVRPPMLPLIMDARVEPGHDAENVAAF